MANKTVTREDGSTVALGGAWGDQAVLDAANVTLEFDPTFKSKVSTVLHDVPQIVTIPQEVIIQDTTASIAVTPTTTTKAANATQQLTVLDASSVNRTVDATYTTSDATKATVSSGGLITAKATGSATVTVSYAGKTGTCVVTVS